MPLVLMRTPEYAQRLEWLVDRATRVEQGTLITHDEMTEALGAMTSSERSALVEHANQALSQSQRLLINVRAVGYKVAVPQEHLDHADSRKRRGQRQVKRGVRSLKACDLRRLTPHEQAAVANKLRCFELMLLQSRKREGKIIDLAAQNRYEQTLIIQDIQEILKKYRQG
jgi:hypothetical protein